MNEFDETEEYENMPEEFGGPSKRAKITKMILRIIGWVIFTAVLGVLFWRMCSTLVREARNIDVLAFFLNHNMALRRLLLNDVKSSLFTSSDGARTGKEHYRTPAALDSPEHCLS